jgi:putative MFS transporter
MSGDERPEHYLRLLLWLLIPAAFFNGFAGELRAVLLPKLQDSFHVSIATLGLANVPIGAGAFVAFFAIRLADRVGRRPLLLVSLFGYAAFTGLTAASPDLWTFALFQSLAQVFLGAEFALAVLLVSEEVDPERRGRVLGKLLIASPMGIVLAAVLNATGLSWRWDYLIGVVPAVAVGLARRYVRESRIFAEARTLPRRPSPTREIFSEPWRTRLFALGAVSFLEKVPVTAGVGWWVYRAEKNLHFSSGLVAVDLAVAVVLGTVGYLVCGSAIDRFGRKRTATVYLILATCFGIALFQSRGELANFCLLIAAVFFGLGIAPALSALSAESFPTLIRAQAGAIIGNGFATTGELTGPALVGLLGERSGIFGGVGGAVCVLSPLMLLAIPILWRYVPETKGAHLDEVGDKGAARGHASRDG